MPHPSIISCTVSQSASKLIHNPPSGPLIHWSHHSHRWKCRCCSSVCLETDAACVLSLVSFEHSSLRVCVGLATSIQWNTGTKHTSPYSLRRMSGRSSFQSHLISKSTPTTSCNPVLLQTPNLFKPRQRISSKKSHFMIPYCRTHPSMTMMMPVSTAIRATTATTAAVAAIAAVSLAEVTKAVRVRPVTRARRSLNVEPASTNILPIQPPTQTTCVPRRGGLA